MTYCWMSIGLASLIRQFELELSNTSDENVEIVRDCFNGQGPPGENRVQVQVLRRIERNPGDYMQIGGLGNADIYR